MKMKRVMIAALAVIIGIAFAACPLDPPPNPVRYGQVTVTVSADQLVNTIDNLPQTSRDAPHTVKVTGEISDWNAVTRAISNNFEQYVILDLSACTNTVLGNGEGSSPKRNFVGITLPPNLEIIGDSAFTGAQFTSITIPESVTTIEEYAFYGSELTSVTIPDSVTTIADHSFNSCEKLTSLTIGNGVTEISWNFMDSALTYLKIPDNVTTIYRSFEDCPTLAVVNIGSGLSSLDEFPFLTCPNLQSFTVDPENLHFSSENDVLLNKDKTYILKCPVKKSGNYTIPASVASISNAAFLGCNSLTGIGITAGPVYINEIIEDCINIESFTVDPANLSYSSEDGVLFNKDKTILIRYPPGNGESQYTIPSTVISVSEIAFEDCSALRVLNIPASLVDLIEYYSYFELFSGSSLTTIAVDPANPAFSSEDGVLFSKDKTTLFKCPPLRSGSYSVPYNVTTIEEYAFTDCSALTNLTIPGSVSNIGPSDSPNYIFSHCTALNSITFGAGSNMVLNLGDYGPLSVYGRRFELLSDAYNAANPKAGTYNWNGTNWIKQ